jgi:hypothetical protein
MLCESPYDLALSLIRVLSIRFRALLCAPRSMIRIVRIVVARRPRAHAPAPRGMRIRGLGAPRMTINTLK